MNTRNWVKFFITTLCIGGAVTVLTGFIIRWKDFRPFFQSFDVLEILSSAFWLFCIGLLFSAVSQMGFFAYLTLHRIGLGIFRSLWNPVQILFLAFALFDLVYFRYRLFAAENEGIFPYLAVALLILLYGILVAYFKMKQSDKETFVPALFFMVVVTVIEWLPALRNNDPNWLQLMIYPLLVCNTYQLLSLPAYLERSQKEREERKKRKEGSGMKPLPPKKAQKV
ncbi:MAG: KinB-signaling pathway activation protein [Caldibacillus debilis]|uniref:KinB-signaling pathway activation in sporulation n=2 Tax=Caldibacillus debilis TaxID=301148 RepID=A0A420VFQ4_9BACI|nr:KinB-signaling pathway activation protein [Caldibacillus debilis]MBY6273533.1 KinB-signaling pathway activation protein [Bacillaceae bacterium]KYD20681.1 hypothetical protein B4135_0063 [Caldibacillus debilis]OUM90673.1 MAG: KinB-signaling pathway activation protein [Caldibacillus debilis]REJ19321.1 MAG: KinB-signaling pathway activation protein [Caldibacillus debilis]REJ30041.1 MAG: KinB-signaling pathway activation protein [Caldibacillus debilis]